MQAALRKFELAIEIDPQNANAHNNAALALAELKRAREAEAAQRRAVQLAPENPDFRVNLAVLLESNSRAEEAAEQFREALRLRPSDIEAQRRLRLIENKRRP